MEEWQRKHINDNLPELIQLTRFNTVVEAELQSQGILSKDDISCLVSDEFLENKKLLTIDECLAYTAICMSYVWFNQAIAKNEDYQKFHNF